MFQQATHKLVLFMDHGGAFPTLCAGTHGYAMGYIVVKKQNGNKKKK